MIAVFSTLVAVFSMFSAPAAGGTWRDGQPVKSSHDLAVLPLPSDMRAGAGIVRWTADNRVEWERASSNGYSCSLDDPADQLFDVRCYEDSMWSALERRKQLSAELENGMAVYKQIELEIENGQLTIPMTPTAGYRMFGPIDSIDLETGEVQPVMNDWQSIHFPYQTSEALGLTEQDEMRQGDPMPFVMASGTWWSHVMIMHDTWKPVKTDK